MSRTLRERIEQAGREAYMGQNMPMIDHAADCALAGARAALEQAQQRYAVIGPYRDMNQIVSDLLADLSPSPAVEPATPPVTALPQEPQSAAAMEAVVICYRCQMCLPLRLTRSAIGPRGGVDAVCAACSPEAGQDGEAKRAEVVAMRRAKWQSMA